jgi:AMP nucleosidase
MKTKLEIAKNWLTRYTGSKIDELALYVLTNFSKYVTILPNDLIVT